MKHSRFSRTFHVAFALAMLTLGGAVRASADAITLSNVQVQLDLLTLSASISAGLTAHSDTASSVFLDGLSVSVLQDGVPLDLSAGPTTLDDAPFFANTPAFMLDGDTLAPVVLFRLLGLVPGASYTTSFFLTEGLDPLEVPPQNVTFTAPLPSATPVPEPASIWLFGAGASGLLFAARRHRSSLRA